MYFPEQVDVPEPVANLLAVLGDADFWVAEHEYNEAAFGNTYITLMRGTMSVRIVRDRGSWSVEIAAPGGSQWFSPMVWSTFIDGELGAHSVPTTDEQQFQFVSAAFDRVSLAIDTEPDALARLLDIQEKRPWTHRR